MTAGTHSRRRFLVRSTALGAVAALAARGARAGEEPAQTPAPAPEPLRCAVIGVGKRGGALLQTLLEGWRGIVANQTTEMDLAEPAVPPPPGQAAGLSLVG